MPKLLKNIEGNIIETTVGEISNNNLIQGAVGKGDYMKLFKFTGFFVNISPNSVVTTFDAPKNHGYKNNRTITELNISY